MAQGLTPAAADRHDRLSRKLESLTLGQSFPGAKARYPGRKAKGGNERTNTDGF
jgi:hypothetical protein